ncbi:hypothetical protein A3H89_05450 [Candidatus Amesbacteria bacterium RIFCSPLOWO2_02_FULL_48_11]|uniref:Glycosyl transferase family 4 n=5 Tax=Candidatus Amesiibacteriota TaxID=1752730 RepID=A0A1F4ZDZ0_9BACT|nr:MAG: Glycosyl transferase, family 4 [Candidatus Amesbacteria bacterium GW2011_GWA2_47_11]KKU94599.1 MAG: Glycosyl transferase, family 4 [Candidatus Amesbacteria bacterium GW2011_GWC1_48_10]KKU98663.1 MAG: Glycosyl transferase, family 4 [Candidatus Amesbacteria bacterium GW2011_GWA1_48_9]OGC89877.1 MAG: hypothetical protein A2V48_04660 [Candidatus Amesbacteria bacterium RBG_19FT_COMBO_48_16]OGC97406.1 MAG: hypothetical protein A3C34_02935 [Candidatus Amesbacteria bacterium RIFCSPHIGHO2_02_FUL
MQAWGSGFWWPLLTSFTAAGIVTGLVVKYGKRLGIMDDPAVHKHPKVVHERPVPRGGGIPIWTALIIGTVIFLPDNKRAWGVVAGATILAITGWWDDRWGEKMSPYLRLGLNVAAALAVIGVGIGIAYITNPWGGIIRLDMPQWCFWLGGERRCIWIMADLFALVWLVWMQNIVGWSSGVDGQLPGFVIIAAITIAALGQRFSGDFGQWPVITTAGITAGAYLGFLLWNFYPQKIMPGYGGKSLAGFLLGVIAIMSGAKVGAMAMVLAVPFIDAFWVIVKRLREGRSPVWGGPDHLHHFLLARKWGRRKIAVFYWGISLVLAIGVLQLNAGAKYFTMAAVALIITGMVLWLQNWSTYSKQRGPDNG